MKDTIKKLYKEKSIACFYTDSSDTDKFNVGYITSYDNEFVAIKSIDRYGNFDGHICIYIDNLFKIESDDIYSKSIEWLYQNKSSNLGYEVDMNKVSSAVLVSLLSFACANNKTCSFKLCKSTMNDNHGIITDITQDNISIEEIDDYGKYGGITTIEIDAICELSCDSIEDRKVEMLREWKNDA